MNNYPYTSEFYTINDIKKMYKNLEKYDYKKRLLYDRYYTIKNLKYNKYKYLFIGRPLIILSEDSDYDDYNKIVDFFQNKERMKCKLYRQKYSPIDYFIKYRKEIENQALQKYKKISPYTIKETIYSLGYECTSFRQTLLITFIKMFNSKKILDFSAGWGERLLSSIFMDVFYTGIDPNINLFEGYYKIIDTFAKNKNKYTLINNTIQNVDLKNEMYDMVFTSPPYFDLEKYTDNNKQSISQYTNEKEWTDNFLKPALKKSYDHLIIGGYMCININQKSKKENYVDEMINYLYTFPDMYYYGVIGYSNKKISNPQPIWIWRKYTTVPKELYNPPFVITNIKHNNINFNVIRDDYLIGGTKQRGLVPLLETIQKDIFIYAGPVYGYAQIALAYSAFLTHKRAVIIVEKRNNLFPLTKYAKSFGAFVKEVPQPAYLEKIILYSKKFYEQDTNKRFLINFGTNDDTFINFMKSNIKDAWGYMEHPNVIWMVAGSSVLLNILYDVFPNTYFNIVQVGKTIWEDQMDTKRTKLYISKEKFTNVEKKQPPYPTVSTYDAKLWDFFEKYGKNGDYIWNVGKDITFTPKKRISDIYKSSLSLS